MWRIVVVLAWVVCVGDGCRLPPSVEQLQRWRLAESLQPFQTLRTRCSNAPAEVNDANERVNAQRRFDPFRAFARILLTCEHMALFNPCLPRVPTLKVAPAPLGVQMMPRDGRGSQDQGAVEHPLQKERAAQPSGECFHQRLPRRTALACAALLSTMRLQAVHAQLSGKTEEELAKQYAAGERANFGIGRGAAALLKERPKTGLVRVGGDPLFKPGQILDSVRSGDGSAVDISFSFPKEWTLARGPNLDVRNILTADAAFVLVAPVPNGEVSVDAISKKFFTDLIFDKKGKFGSYGVPDGFKLKKWDVATLPNTGGSQMYRRFALLFDANTYNQNIVETNALISSTVLGGSVFVLVATSNRNRYKMMEAALTEIQEGFRVYGGSKRVIEKPSERPPSDDDFG